MAVEEIYEPYEDVQHNSIPKQQSIGTTNKNSY